MSFNIVADFQKTDEFWRNETLPATNRQINNEDIPNKPQTKGKIEYEENIKRPAGKTFLPKDFVIDEITEVIPGRAWVLPNVLTEDECADWIARGEAAGLKKSDKQVGTQLRTNSRTSYYFDATMSSQIKPRLTNDLISNIEKSEPGSAFRGVHDNWKMSKYEKGETFPAHYDQDSYQNLPPNERGIKERETSSHTLLFYLTNDFEGGATRFFPTGDFKSSDDAIDVRLPQGGVLIFEQHGLLHNGMEVESGIKYIAQSAILRAQPEGLSKPAVFRWGPGLKPY